MFEFSDSGVTLATILETRKANADGLCPVKVRVTHQRQRAYYSTGKRLTLEDWEKLPTTKARELKAIRESIQKFANEFEATVRLLIKNDQFSIDNLQAQLSKGQSSTVDAAFSAKIEELKARGKISTSDWYKYTLRSIGLYRKGKKTEFKHITIDWLRQYEQYLLDEGKSYTTISMYMRALQVVVNDAKAAGIIKPAQHPFGKGRYEIPQHAGRNIALTLSDIKKIVQYECETDTIEKCRDLWFFSYLCNGANITDICKLRYSSIRNGEVCFYRQKTLAKAKKKKLIHATLLPEMQGIIDRWGNIEESPETFVFPILQGEESPAEERTKIKNITKLMNTKLKAIGKKLGIPNISTYTARHSYATVLKRSGANIAFISESLGHNDLKTTENYLASFEQEERVKNAALLTNF
ncbi:site-specific integrase [Pontibacter lucknowensis]|uniref:Site-specific recombinase XerD n=1 Tax=Pontibacter lucknowensis TaxID=1077936 RepID=A0A1N7A0M3_9BACT|nr:site-specific integrase [Pontibacter lucknowensis]SIR32588.1 Site-specific recombinase XerD [Pontibacter lucknowensis]